MLSVCCQHVVCMLPISCQHVASMLLACCQHVASLLPANYLHVASMLQAYWEHVASMLLAVRQHVGDILLQCCQQPHVRQLTLLTSTPDAAAVGVQQRHVQGCDAGRTELRRGLQDHQLHHLHQHLHLSVVRRGRLISRYIQFIHNSKLLLLLRFYKKKK